MEPAPLPLRSGAAEAAGRELARLIEVMATLRSEGGCPWDRAQTWESLRRYVLEEAYELVDAVDRKNPTAVREECGDVLLEVVFIARIAEEAGRFGMTEVTREIRRKLVRRHPHVFGAASPAESARQALESWEAVKAQEKGKRTLVTGGLPALLLAGKVLERSAAAGRTSTVPNGKAAGEVAGSSAAARIRDALNRMEARRQGADPAAAERALGELLLGAAAWAFGEGLDPEAALRGAVRRLAERLADPAAEL